MPHKDPNERKTYLREYYLGKREHFTEKEKQKYRVEHPDVVPETKPRNMRDYQHEYYELNKERVAKRNHARLEQRRIREAQRNNSPEGLAYREQKRTYHREWVKEHGIRARIMDALGNVCKECGITDREVLQIDHVHGQGTRERRLFKNTEEHMKHVLQNVTSGDYQLLCANCNWKKRHANKEHRYRYDQE